MITGYNNSHSKFSIHVLKKRYSLPTFPQITHFITKNAKLIFDIWYRKNYLCTRKKEVFSQKINSCLINT